MMSLPGAFDQFLNKSGAKTLWLVFAQGAIMSKVGTQYPLLFLIHCLPHQSVSIGSGIKAHLVLPFIYLYFFQQQGVFSLSCMNQTFKQSCTQFGMHQSFWVCQKYDKLHLSLWFFFSGRQVNLLKSYHSSLLLLWCIIQVYVFYGVATHNQNPFMFSQAGLLLCLGSSNGRLLDLPGSLVACLWFRSGMQHWIGFCWFGF